MANSKTTKRALLTSCISLLLCFSMLLGTTFAWFTDTVTSANNIIKSGNLDVEFEYWDGNSWKTVKGASDILAYELWEPGYTEVAYLRVANKGSLALKYQLGVNIVSEKEGVNAAGNTFKLSDSIMFGVVEGITEDAYDKTDAGRAEAIADVTDAKKISAGYTEESTIKANDPDHYFALVVYMPTTVGDEANHNGTDIPQIDLGINVVATQFNSEEDSFSTDYDKDAQYPAESTVTIPDSGEETVIVAKEVSAIIPAAAEAGDYTLNVSNKYTKVNSDYESAIAYDITLYKDSVKVEGTDITIKINVGTGLNITNVTHNGTPIEFTYDKDAGVVTFVTDSFSPFEIAYLTVNADTVVTTDSEFKSLIANGGNAFLTEKFTVEDFSSGIQKGATIQGGTLSRETGNGNPLTVNTTEKVTFDKVTFETVKGGAVLATRTDGANIEVNNSTFTNLSSPSTGNVGVQVYANNVTMTFNNCTFNNMPVITNSSYPDGIKLIFNNCTFNWNGDNCPGAIQIGNDLKIQIDINNCKMNYTTDSQYTTAKTMISYNWPEASTININGLTVTGTRNNDKIWKIASNNNKVTINTSGTLVYTFNGEAVDFNTYLK